MWDWSIVSIIWLCLLIAAILGFIIGWLLKTLLGGNNTEKFAEYESKIRDRDTEIANWKKKNSICLLKAPGRILTGK